MDVRDEDSLTRADNEKFPQHMIHDLVVKLLVYIFEGLDLNSVH